jgi:putative transposase
VVIGANPVAASRFRIDRWYPSSQRCRTCGYIYIALTLDMRQWTSLNPEECGVVHGRDLNAAKYMLAVGLTVNACGEAVRPARAMSNMPNLARPR